MNGKFKKTLKERCPVCGKVLHLREIEYSGVAFGHRARLHEDIIQCSNPNCEYERDVRQNGKKRRKSPLE